MNVFGHGALKKKASVEKDIQNASIDVQNSEGTAKFTDFKTLVWLENPLPSVSFVV